MNKTFSVLMLFALVISCVEKNPVENILESYVKEKAGGFDFGKMDYKLENYSMLDSVTNKDLLDSLETDLVCNAFVWYEPSKDSLLAIRNTKFPAYVLNDQDNVAMIDQHKAIVDSLLSVWDDVTPFSYELNYVANWFTVAKCAFYGIEPGDRISEHFNYMVENKDTYRQADSIYKQNPDDVYAYKILHNYSIFNDIFNKRVSISNIVFLDKDMQYKSSETTNTIEDMLQQISE